MDFEGNTNNKQEEDEMNLHEEEEEDDAVCESPPLPPPSHGGSRFRFRECLKNQAVNIGGHALDGCGEFMPAGTEGTMDALKCAACGCHRNFHRKESLYFHHPPPPLVSYRPPPSQASPLQLALPPPSETSSMEAGGVRKRFRTKFTAEQKERMLGLAEKIGWRFQRQDDEVIQRFCQETGVPRQVLKVWLHNNKHTRGKSSSSPLDHHQNPPPQSSSYHYEQESNHDS